MGVFFQEPIIITQASGVDQFLEAGQLGIKMLVFWNPTPDRFPGDAAAVGVWFRYPPHLAAFVCLQTGWYTELYDIVYMSY